MQSIALTNSDDVVHVSDADYDRCRRHRWRMHTANASGKPYARAEIAGRTIYMHRWIVGPERIPIGYRVDHVDGHGLHNWRSNLRVCSQNDNNHHQAAYGLVPYKGVTKQGGFLARIQCDGERRRLGVFATAYEAAIAYDVAAYAMFGEFAWLNFPELFPAALDALAAEEPPF